MSARTIRRRAPRVVAWLAFAIALFAPLLANDVPLVARAGGVTTFPAVADWFGEPPAAPHAAGWKEWARALPEGGEDFAWLPPWPYGPFETEPRRMHEGPSLAHPFGCDDTGRDVLARIVHGTRTALGLGAGVVLVAGLAGITLGVVAGFFRGFADVVVLRLIELFACFPGLLLLIAAATFFGDSSLGFVLALGALLWTSFARLVRGELLSLRERDFVAAARGLGVGNAKILLRHLLPQMQSQIAITAAFVLAGTVVAESTLSFLGLGPGLAASSWGSVLQQGRAYAHLGAWHLWFFPSAALLGTVLCCHALADQLRERDPR